MNIIRELCGGGGIYVILRIPTFGYLGISKLHDRGLPDRSLSKLSNPVPVGTINEKILQNVLPLQI